MKEYHLYTMWGKQDYFDPQGHPMIYYPDRGDPFTMPFVYAMKIKHESGNIEYLVRKNKEGKLYNPIGMYQNGKANILDRHTKEPIWPFTRVNEEAFLYYISFLKSKNSFLLSQSERCLI